MSENTILCKCLVCLKQNANGVPVSMRTYIRHRKNQQEFLDVEETNISHQEQNVKDLHQQEDLHQDLHQQEDIYQQNTDDTYNTDGTDDTESINFDEEDDEYYSNYNEDDDKSKDIDNEDNEDTMHNSDENSDNEDIMQIDNESDTTPSKEIIEGLKLLYLKSLYNFTESAYDDIMKVFTTNNLSLYKIKKYLK